MKKVIQSLAIVMFLSGVINQVSAKSNCIPENNKAADLECREDMVGGAYLTFAGKFGGEISQEELASTTELGIEGCAHGSKIYAFNLEIRSAGEIKRIKGDSFVLAKEVLKSLKALNAGDTFEFKEIKAHLPDGGKIDAIGRVFTIV